MYRSHIGDHNDSEMIRAFASGTGVIGLDPGTRDTKNVKNGTKKYLASLSLMILKASTGISSPQKKKKKNNFSDGNTIIEVVVGYGQFSSINR